MSSWAKPGVKCALVFTNPAWVEVPFVRVPQLGVIYTVADVLMCDSEPVLRLEEVQNDDLEFQISWNPIIFGAPVFGIFRFRPVVELDVQDDVALFAHHLLVQGELA